MMPEKANWEDGLAAEIADDESMHWIRKHMILAIASDLRRLYGQKGCTPSCT
jgi:hypothetical protein